MKLKFYTVILFTLALLGTTNVSNAQQKIGYINSSEIVSLMPETKKADTSFEAYATQLQGALQSIAEKIQKEMDDYQKNEKVMTEAMKETKRSEIVAMQNNLQEQQQQAQEKLEKKKAELYQPIFDKVNKAIEKVAKDNKYSYVMDSSSGTLLYADQTLNILQLVKKELNIL